MSDQIAQAAADMGIDPDITVNLRADYRHPASADGSSWHRHVALEWEGGVLWLDMSEQADHFCIDVRQYRDGSAVPVGMFSILNGYSVRMDDSGVPEDQRLKAHGWPATRMPILLTDK